MTIREKNKEKLLHENTLRNRLKNLTSNQKVAVIYKNKMVGIGLPEFLLNETSDDFMGLLNNEIKETVKGVTIYLII